MQQIAALPDANYQRLVVISLHVSTSRMEVFLSSRGGRRFQFSHWGAADRHPP